MVEEAVRLGFEQRRPFAGAGAFDGRAGRLEDRHRIHAVHHHAGHPVASGAVGHIDDGLVVRLRRVFAVAVVFADEDARQPIQGGHVGGFVE